MDFKIKNDSAFLIELQSVKEYFDSNPNLTEGLIEIKKRVDTIHSIVYKNAIMLYEQDGYSFLRPFEDSFQDAVDFFKTKIGERVKQIFFYFGYKYQVPESQKSGYNIDPNSNL